MSVGAAVASPRPPRQLFVVVERGNAGMRMRIAPADRGERFAVVNGTVGIIAIELIGDGNRDSLTEAYHAFRNLDLPGGDTPSRDRLLHAFADWQAALAQSDITLRLQREALYGQPLQRHAWAADAGGVSLRPWDIELTALATHLRRVVKFDQVPRQFVDGLQQRCEQRGFMVGSVTAKDGGDGSTTVLVATDASALAKALHLESRLLVRRGNQTVDGAASQLGELLGYPPCCIERFARVAEHNDTTLAWALLPETPAPASPLTQWLQPGLALLSHSPCALTCTASIALATRLLEAVDSTDPGFAVRWRALATRVQVVDHGGRRLALAVDGCLESPQRILAADLLSSGKPSTSSSQPVPALAGRDVFIECGGVVTPDGDWYAPFVADHRGPG